MIGPDSASAIGRDPFDPPPPPLARRAAPWISVTAGSLTTAWPMVAAHPVLPPFGLMMLVAWRLLRPGALPVWSPALLGLFDDLVSGQPLGSAVLLWSLASLTIEIIDARLSASRDFWLDWMVAAGAIVGTLVGGRLLAVPFAAHVDTMLLIQAMASVLLFPLVMRIVAWVNRRRGAA